MLAPKYPISSRVVSRCSRNHLVTPTSRPPSRPILKTFDRSVSSETEAIVEPGDVPLEVELIEVEATGTLSPAELVR